MATIPIPAIPELDGIPLLPTPGLDELAVCLGLAAAEVQAVRLVAAVDENIEVGRAIARLQAPIGGARPTLAFLSSTLNIPIRDLLRCPILTVLNETAPIPERPVSVPQPIWSALYGDDGRELVPAPDIPLPPSFEEEIDRIAASSWDATRVVAIRSGSNAEARAVAAAICGRLGLRPCFLEPSDKTDHLGLWLWLRRLIPVFSLELGPGERRILPPVPHYRGPALVVAGPDGTIDVPGATVLDWRLPVPPAAERKLLWNLAIGPAAPAPYLNRHGAGRIAHLGRLANWRAGIEGRETPNAEDILHASWTSEGAGLESLAQPLPEPIPDEALVLDDATRKQLRTLLLRCRTRDALARDLGASAKARYHPGVRALLVGPSGTGKTLAAGWIATQLGMPLYRVDLAAVNSKYIGETEKNLAQLLARAEQAELILLFDEADSVFGKRTDIKDANDRFANAQTNYLLQRLESYDGIVVLTSNSRSRFDSAFFRRLDLIVDFPAPGPQERRLLWKSHLGAGHDLTAIELNLLAASSADLTGGNIRNVVLAAALTAHSESRRIGFADVLDGLAMEMRKLGKQVPPEISIRESPGR